ncbi:MAG: hypothetical protein HC895_06040 [Leptolyngbyaceae cyanobacterium SM1_3_5]|nr:hypothetical protein [Leptolyngbyaceae cyanobacterium SM1_3_5]
MIRQEEADRIRQFKENPDSLQPFLQQRETELRNQLQTQVGLRREQAQRTARSASLKSGLSTGLSSLLLAIGFSIVGWSACDRSEKQADAGARIRCKGLASHIPTP